MLLRVHRPKPLRIVKSLSSMRGPPSLADLPTARPRPSASLIIVNARNELLFVQRHPQASAFAGFHVFPGGNFDESQDDCPEITAIRETFEESGLLLASSSSSPSHTMDELVLTEAREAIHARRIKFRSFLEDHRLKVDLASLLPFTQWVTPTNIIINNNAPRRFHTHFFLVFMSSNSSPGFSSGRKEEYVPTPDGGKEVIAAQFLHPKQAISGMQAGKFTFMPPQFYIVSTLSEILLGSENTQAQRDRIKTLSRGPFGSMVIHPRVLGKHDEEGRVVLTLEGDETRDGSKGRQHRVLVRFVKNVPVDITLLRNIDIFAGIEQHTFGGPKL